jgi:cytosine/adenosine deaminase-related metal-dependent hydrolase
MSKALISSRARPAAEEATMPVDRILLKGGCVLTLDPDIGNYRQGDVLIEGSRIESVGPKLKVSDAEVIDASNMIVMPGFVDSHRHIWEGILKNIAPDA